MFELDFLRTLAAPLLALATVVYFDLATRRRGLDPPGFAHPLRRTFGHSALFLVLWVAAFEPLLSLGEATDALPDFAAVPTVQFFSVHALLVLAIATWYVAGFAGISRAHASIQGAEGMAQGPPTATPGLARQLGLRAPRPFRELGLGVVLGLSTWSLLILSVLAIVLLITTIAGDDILPQAPPPMIPFIAGLPFLIRLMISVSAGVFEELFFRGLLQPRIGVIASTALFVLAHAGYGQPLMFIGITLLSLLYAAVVRWRQSIWAAIAAHATFDAIQLLVVIPSVLELMGPGGGAAGE